MLRNLTRQFLVIGAIALGEAAVIAIVLLMTGWFQPDTPNDYFGIYNSAYSGLPAYHNPAIDTVWFIETVTLLSLPIILALLRKYLRIAVRPWLVVAVAIVLANVVWPGDFVGDDRTAHDPSVESILPYFVQTQVITIVAVVASYGWPAWKARYGVKQQAPMTRSKSRTRTWAPTNRHVSRRAAR